MTFGNQAGVGVGVGVPAPLSRPEITTTSRPDADAGHRGPVPSRPHLVSQCYLLSYKLTTFGEVVQLLCSFLFLAFLISTSFTLLCPPAVCLLTPAFHKRTSLFVVSGAMFSPPLGSFIGLHLVRQTPGLVLMCSREREGLGVSNIENTSIRELCSGPSYPVLLAVDSMLRSQQLHMK